MARPRRQGARREQILQATRRVLARRGVAGVTVRDVAAEADLSPGSVLYYYPEFSDAVVLAIDGVVERFYTRRLALLERVTDLRQRLVTLVRAGVPDEPDAELRLVYESVGLVPQRPDLVPVLRSMTERQVSLYRSTIEAGALTGVFAPVAAAGVVARNVVALEDAFGLYVVTGAYPDAEAAREHVLAYVADALRCDLSGVSPATRPGAATGS